MRLRIYTDGACSGNPGPGGWAAVFTMPRQIKSIHGCDISTTNNRMELTSVIRSIQYVVDGKLDGECGSIDALDIHSDSAYVVNAINNGWIDVWKRKQWVTQGGKGVKNQDLWEKLVGLLESAKRKGIYVSFVKVKGHSGNTFNEMVDKLAVGESIHAQAASNALRVRG